MSPIDTVRDRYYKPLEKVENVGDVLFVVCSVLSIATLVVDRVACPRIYYFMQIFFTIFVLLLFIQSMASKLYFFPRAQDKRRQELLSNSFGDVPLTSESTVGYYNNDQRIPLKRLAASVMESAFFTAYIARKMLLLERSKMILYFVLYFLAVLYRATDLEMLAVAAQVLFSENVISKWLRMEWLRLRSERVCENLHQMFASNPAFSRPVAQSQSVDMFSFYETTKSTASILLSSRIFNKHNAQLSEEWEAMRSKLGL